LQVWSRSCLLVIVWCGSSSSVGSDSREEAVAHAELLLRRENYGGFVFLPDEATYVHLDAEAFELARRVFREQGVPQSPKETEMIREIRAQLFPLGSPSSLGVRALDLEDERITEKWPSLGVVSAPMLVDFQITRACDKGCPQCYASSSLTGNSVLWEDVLLAVRQMRDLGVGQVAIGGGEPLLHSRWSDILACVRDHGMVPNVTTASMALSTQQIKSLARYCGAVALSLEGVGVRFAKRRRYGFAAFEHQARALVDAGLNLVVQVTLSDENLLELPEMTEYLSGIKGLYGVIFLAHKPVGRGTFFDRPLAVRPPVEIREFLLPAVRQLMGHARVGFDCCLSPMLASLEGALGYERGQTLEGCSAVRGSLGLTPELDVLPCTFLPEKILGNLHSTPLLEVWRGSGADLFRGDILKSSQRTQCQACAVQSHCLGGCPVWDLVGCS